VSGDSLLRAPVELEYQAVGDVVVAAPSVSPGGLDYLLGKSEVPVVARPYPAFRSWYEDGCRDVRQLYPVDFYDKITKLPRLPYSSND
jgi:hypothetical protein